MTASPLAPSLLDAAGVDPERAFEAEFLLMAGQCGPMLDELLTSFGLPSAA